MFSHIAARAGAKVTVLQRADHMLTQFDPELVGWLMETFSEIGVDVRTGTVLDAVERAGSSLRVHARAGSRVVAIDAEWFMPPAAFRSQRARFGRGRRPLSRRGGWS